MHSIPNMGQDGLGWNRDLPIAIHTLIQASLMSLMFQWLVMLLLLPEERAVVAVLCCIKRKKYAFCPFFSLSTYLWLRLPSFATRGAKGLTCCHPFFLYLAAQQPPVVQCAGLLQIHQNRPLLSFCCPSSSL